MASAFVIQKYVIASFFDSHSYTEKHTRTITRGAFINCSNQGKYFVCKMIFQVFFSELNVREEALSTNKCFEASLVINLQQI